MSFDVESVEVVELCLTLIELIQVCILQSNPSMTLIDLLRVGKGKGNKLTLTVSLF
jgi:hypothetical protein